MMPPTLAPRRAMDTARPCNRSNQGESVVLIDVGDRQDLPAPSRAKTANSCQASTQKARPATASAVTTAPAPITRFGPNLTMAAPTPARQTAVTR